MGQNTENSKEKRAGDGPMGLALATPSKLSLGMLGWDSGNPHFSFTSWLPGRLQRLQDLLLPLQFLLALVSHCHPRTHRVWQCLSVRKLKQVYRLAALNTTSLVTSPEHPPSPATWCLDLGLSFWDLCFKLQRVNNAATSVHPQQHHKWLPTTHLCGVLMFFTPLRLATLLCNIVYYPRL